MRLQTEPETVSNEWGYKTNGTSLCIQRIKQNTPFLGHRSQRLQ